MGATGDIIIEAVSNDDPKAKGTVTLTVDPFQAAYGAPGNDRGFINRVVGAGVQDNTYSVGVILPGPNFQESWSVVSTGGIFAATNAATGDSISVTGGSAGMHGTITTRDGSQLRIDGDRVCAPQ